MFNGQLRHANAFGGRNYADNVPGVKKGSRFLDGDVIGILVDRVVGTMTYFKNGISLGLAFETPELLKGDLRPAVASICE